MYLSRLTLDPRSAQARRDLADPYDMHRTLVRAFVQGESEKPPRFLWRLEPENAWCTPTVLVQSEKLAQWQVLDELPGYLQKHESKPVDLAKLLQEQVCYRFRLFANPTVSRDGKRYGLAAEDAQLAWLQRQGERQGFKVESALVTASDVLKSHKGKGGSFIHLQRACFEGVLRALDVQVLADALKNGIGPGKAFGCGLLSVVRV